jgi:hypothetical protein
MSHEEGPSTGCGDCGSHTRNEDAARTFYLPAGVWEPTLSSSPRNEWKNFELIPAPLINVTMENFYSGESIIGYTYNVTLTGYAAHKQSREEDNGASIDWVVTSIAKLQSILDGAGNGGNLVIMSPHEEKGPLMRFRGGRIKSINYPPNDNQWVNYSEYTLEIEFNDAEFFGCDTQHIKNCSSVFFDGTSHPNGIDTIQNKLVDLKKFKIKAFNDQWNISLGDEIYDWALVDRSLEVNNKRYNIQYTISATGQHYWDDQGNLFPAWKQAKAFCQDRLVKQINALYDNMAMHYIGPELQYCGSEENLTSIHNRTSPSIHTTIGPMHIFNENITFDVGEADGTFSVTYSSVVKKAKETCITSADTIHNISITYGGSNTCGQNKMAKTANLSGTIEGMVRFTEGSIIWPNAEGFRIPDTPGQIVFLPPKGDVKYKWDRAKDLLDRFLDECDGKIVCGELCDIVLKCMTPPDSDECKDICGPSCPRPSNFSVTHNYNAGTIDYSVDFSYDSNDRDGNRCNITISTEEPVPLTAEFTIPGRGIYYQPLGGCTPRKWTINAEGRVDGYDDVSCNDLPGYLSVCGCLPKGCSGLIPPGNGYLLISKQQTFSPLDGSFSYNATYVCTICPGLYQECGPCQ